MYRIARFPKSWIHLDTHVPVLARQLGYGIDEWDTYVDKHTT